MTWALTRALQDKVDAFDNMCLRHIFRIPYMDHVTNTTVRLQAGSPPQLSQLIQARRLQFLPARRYASAGNSDRNVSVRLSVRLSRAGIVSKRRKLAS